jgi:hypothetical protein
VNIVDLIEWDEIVGVTKQESRPSVMWWGCGTTPKRQGKIYRNTLDQAGSNVVMRHLLRKIYRENL